MISILRSCYRLSEKLQQENFLDRDAAVRTLFGIDLIKHLDSYMDIVQFLMCCVASGLLILYYMATQTNIADIKAAKCFDPPVPIPGFGPQGYCNFIAHEGLCPTLSDQRLCPASCLYTPCEEFDEIISKWGLTSGFLLPALGMFLIVVLTFLSTRQGDLFDKEFSNAIWFLSIWLSGVSFFNSTMMYERGETMDWMQGYRMDAYIEDWYKTALKVSGNLNTVAVVALILNSVLASLYIEALEDKMDMKRSAATKDDDLEEFPEQAVEMASNEIGIE